MNRFPLQRLQTWLWLAPVLMAFGAGSNVLQNGFGWDDLDIILSLRPPDPWWSLFLPDFSAPSASREVSSYFRPLVAASYLLDYKIWRDQPFGFHLSVLLAHLINTGLVFFLVRKLATQAEVVPAQTRRPVPPDFEQTLRRCLPVLAASLFAVHPVHSEAVAWIAGRNDVFCTTLMLASFVWYAQAHPPVVSGGAARAGLKRHIFYSLAMAAFAAALLTKEIAVGLVLVFLAYEYLADAPPKSLMDKKRPSRTVEPSAVPVLRRMAARLWMPILILVFYFVSRNIKIAHPYGDASDLTLFSGATVWKIIGAVGLYVKQMVFPYPHAPFIAAIPGDFPFRILSVAVVLLLSAGALLVFRRRRLLLAVGLVWTMVTLAPALWVAALHVTPAPAAERYLYAPSVGFVTAAAWLILKGLSRLPMDAGRPRRMIGIAAGMIGAALIGAWGWESWERNAVWRTPATFWEAAVAASPDAGFPNRQLAVQYYQAGQYAKAEPFFQRAIAAYEKTLGPDHPDLAQALSGLGALYYAGGRYAEAEPLLGRSLVIREKAVGPEHSETAKSLNNLGALYYAQGRYDRAELFYRRVLGIWEKRLGPDHADVATVLDNLAALHYAQGRFAEAEPLFRRSLAIRERILGPNHPDLATGLGNLAGLYYALGRYDEADPLFRRSLTIRENSLGPDHPLVVMSLRNYAVLLRKTHREAEARTMEERAAMIRARRAPSSP